MVARGELWWTDLGPPRGSAPAYRRPVVVVSADTFNETPVRTVTAVSVMSNTRLAQMPGNVYLPKGTAGLQGNSVVNVTQVTTIDREDLEEFLGVLPVHLMDQVDAGLRLALGL